MKSLIVGIIILSLLTSCDSYHKNLKGTNFNVGWINLPELTTINYNDPNGGWLGVTEQRITDVYWNEEYILAKRCENRTDSILGYYIIKILHHNYTPLKYVCLVSSSTHSIINGGIRIIQGRNTVLI